jgi:hypothetical protein
MPNPCCGPAGPLPYLLVCELEVDADSPSATAFTGGQGAWNATVEYLVDQGVSDPAVEVTIQSNGATTDWKDSGIAPGFHSKTLGPLAAGAKISLTATNSLARVRWCEPVCC